ncbi:CDP-glycerol glycerophosphotransferase family protein [Blautia sp. MSJ-19]|uniref:CDP-glycerol glycerophosphotransferase family protein n=1 Tax=Blautia sp. MSJ-19 TaxID=2841517 RepID=UPI001C0EE0A4|nr:CDP-glycerol glycerophosphotransferase family protein [Blautia sp. MSJ-19]MBU5480562.1 CDP-glycerol glycerophosphotransferase family protein [Blautia sp. MSJ-19]
MSFLGKVKNKLKSGSWYPFYNSFYERNSLDPHMILLESRSGKALESNILSLLKELCKEPYHKFTLVLSVHKSVENEIKEKLHKNSIQGVHFVRTGSVAYYRALSRAGYLVNDSSFPGRFIKKDGQIYLNTWHGTPLKKMGRDNRPEMVTMGNVLRNLLDSDYLVFPNRFMEEKMSGAYMLDKLYRGTVLHEGYPRNDIFRHKPDSALKERAGLRDKFLITYFPTYRGIFNQVEQQEYMQTLSDSLSLWDQQLNDNEILLVKLHPFLHGSENFDHYRHIRAFPSDWDTYEGLSLCDTLITDYSSVFYDYANSGKKIIFYAYDRLEYESTRGMYENLESYPFHYTEKAEDVIPFVHQNGGTPTDAFMETYATYEDGHGAEKICRQVFLGENCCRTRTYCGNGKQNILLYGGDLDQNGITSALYAMLHELDLDKYNYFLSFRLISVKEHPERMNRIPEHVGIYPLASEMNMDILTGLALMYKMRGKNSSLADRRVHTAYRREWQKHFGSTEFSAVVHYNGYEAYITSLFEESPCGRVIWVHNDMADEIRTKGNQNLPLLHEAYQTYDHIVTVSNDILDSTIHGIGADPARVMVINNCHDHQTVLKRSLESFSFQETTRSTVSPEKLSQILNGQGHKFISIGRYSPEKGHTRLLNAFNTYWTSHPDTWLILIGGVGTLYDEEVSYARSLAAADHIVLIYSMQNPMPVLRCCDLFLLSSFYEGRPIVLMEAATLGIPVVTCDVNGCHGFMTEYHGTLVESSEEGILQGMNLFAEGKVLPLQVDFDQINAVSSSLTEQLFSDTVRISHHERT